MCIKCGKKIHEDVLDTLSVYGSNAMNYTCPSCQTELALRMAFTEDEFSVAYSFNERYSGKLITEQELIYSRELFIFRITYKNFRTYLYSVEVSLPNEPQFEYQFNKDNLYKLFKKLTEDGYDRSRKNSESGLNIFYNIGNKEYMDIVLKKSSKPESNSKPVIEELIEISEEVISKYLDISKCLDKLEIRNKRD